MAEKPSSGNKIGISSDWTQDCVTCPYDKSHRILPNRLVLHMNRCARNYCGTKLVRCPFNIAHVLTVAEMENHVITCLDRASFVRFLNPDKLPPLKPKDSLSPQENLVDTSADWDRDPDVPSYDPSHYCENNPIVRTLRGESPSVRREFRELERKRFRNFRNQSGLESVGETPNEVTNFNLAEDDQLADRFYALKMKENLDSVANNKENSDKF